MSNNQGRGLGCVSVCIDDTVNMLYEKSALFPTKSDRTFQIFKVKVCV